MIWMYIIGAIVAQAIVVVLLNEYLNRRCEPPAAAIQPQEASPPQPSPVVPEAKESANTVTTGDAVGKSNWTVEELKAMMEDVVKPIRECVESMMDAKDAEFDVKDEVTTPPMRMSPEREARAWEDHRDEEALLDREDNTVAPPNPLASGVDFDSLTKASSIVQSEESQPIGALQFAMNVFRTVDGTQFSGCLPDSLLEKLYECHRKVEMNDEAFREDKSENVVISDEVTSEKSPEVKQQVEEKPEPKVDPVTEPEVKADPVPRFQKSFLKQPQSQN